MDLDEPRIHFDFGRTLMGGTVWKSCFFWLDDKLALRVRVPLQVIIFGEMQRYVPCSSFRPIVVWHGWIFKQSAVRNLS